jgi:hypothetical protein
MNVEQMRVAAECAEAICKAYEIDRLYAKMNGEKYKPEPTPDGRGPAEWKAEAKRLRAAIRATKTKL